MQKLIIEKVFYSLSKIRNFNYDWIKNQLLLYICDKNKIKKNKIVHTIELRYIFLLQNSNLVNTVLTNIAADNIGGCTIYTSLDISIRNKNNKLNTIFNL